MIKIGIVGYGNVGRGVESVIKYCKDMEVMGVFTRRDCTCVQTTTKIPVFDITSIYDKKGDFDVLILCGGSANDLPWQSVAIAEHFNIVDSFDTHVKITDHFTHVNEASLKGNHVAIISAGWDPGLFSFYRALGQAVLPQGSNYTFWGTGVSQGHSDAIRRIDGVKDAREYTIPIETAIQRVRNGEYVNLNEAEKHTRECYVVIEEGANKNKIATTIKTMPNYFSGYETTIHFIEEDELKKNHQKMPHGGVVIRNGTTGVNNENKHALECKITLDSNPEFTASILLAYARAAYRLYEEGQRGCKTVFDIAVGYLHEASPQELRKNLL